MKYLCMADASTATTATTAVASISARSSPLRRLGMRTTAVIASITARMSSGADSNISKRLSLIRQNHIVISTAGMQVRRPIKRTAGACLRPGVRLQPLRGLRGVKRRAAQPVRFSFENLRASQSGLDHASKTSAAGAATSPLFFRANFNKA